MASQSKRNERIERPATSYRRPTRNYKMHTIWTYELKTDLHEAYIQSEPEKKGFIARMKTIWDRKQQEYSHILGRNLKDRVTRLIRNNEISTNVKKRQSITTNANERQSRRNIERQHQITPAHKARSEILPSPATRAYERQTTQSYTTRTGLMPPSATHTSERQPTHAAHTEIIPPSTASARVATPHKQRDLENVLRESFKNNFTKFINVTIDEREFQTRIDRHIPEKQLAAMNV